MYVFPSMNIFEHNIIDMHVHIFPPKMFEAVWHYFESFGWTVHHEHVDRIQQTLMEYGISMCVGLSYPHKAGVARSLNNFMESIGKRFPFFRPFASVHPEDDDFRLYVDHALKSPNLYGFKFQPLVQRFDVNDPRLDYLYMQSIERKFPIIMHIGTGPIANEFVGIGHFRKLMNRFPELRICVPHMGAMEYDDFLHMLGDYPGMYLDTTMINTKTDLFENTWIGDNDALLRHTDRICFGSDWPNVPYSYQEALDSIKRFPLPDESLPDVLYRNAMRFLESKKFS